MRDEHYLKATRRKKIKVCSNNCICTCYMDFPSQQKPTSMMEVPSLLQNVEFPHPGMSYNPTFDDHQVINFKRSM